MNETMNYTQKVIKCDVLAMSDEPLSVEPLVEILKRKLKGEKGIARKWLKAKIKQLTK
jgi:hypothetical protein